MELPKISGAQVRSSLLYGVLFALFFLFFVYISFPYTVVKELLTNIVNNNNGMGMRLEIESLSPHLGGGVTARGVQIRFGSGSDGGFTLGDVEVDLEIWRLLTGKVGVVVTIVAPDGGEIEVGGAAGIWGVVTGNPTISRVSFEAVDFVIDRLFGVVLSHAGGAAVGPTWAPLLAGVALSGKLGGEMDMTLGGGSMSQADGALNFNLAQAKLKNQDPPIELEFQKAQVALRCDRGECVLDKDVGLQSSGLSIILNGKVTFKDPVPTSPIDATVQVALKDAILEDFGNAVELALMASGNAGGLRDGTFGLQLRGTLGQMTQTVQ